MTHPIQSVEYGTYLWVMRELGFVLGVSRDESTWDFQTYGRLDSIVQSGYHQFCYAPPQEELAHRGGVDSVTTDGEVSTGAEPSEQQKDRRNRAPHAWSFLRGLEQLSLVAGQTEYDAPEDFTGIVGDLIVTTGEGRLPIVGDDQLRSLLAKDGAAGTPKYVAVRPKILDGKGSQRWKIIVYPAPDKAMTVTFRYTLTPGRFDAENPYPLGGRQHAETLLASCIAVAEEREGAVRGMPVGAAYSKFMQRLAASIHLDRQASRPTGDGTTWREEESEADKLRGQIGFFMGFGQDQNGWSESQRQQVREAQRQGLRRFYVPPPLTGRGQAHVWSFLYPIASMTLESGKSEYDLPADFGGLDSPLTYAPGTNVLYPSIQVVAEQDVRRWQQTSTQADGRPTRAAIRQKNSPQTGGTRYEVLFWPVPDDAYHLHYRYRVSPGDDLDIIHGGSAHMQTIIEACLAAAEAMLNKRQRIHEQRFLERLAASISYDQQLSSPGELGYNYDMSDRSGRDITDDLHRLGYGESGVTYNGVRY